LEQQQRSNSNELAGKVLRQIEEIVEAIVIGLIASGAWAVLLMHAFQWKSTISRKAS